MADFFKFLTTAEVVNDVVVKDAKIQVSLNVNDFLKIFPPLSILVGHTLSQDR